MKKDKPNSKKHKPRMKQRMLRQQVLSEPQRERLESLMMPSLLLNLRGNRSKMLIKNSENLRKLHKIKHMLQLTPLLKQHIDFNKQDQKLPKKRLELKHKRLSPRQQSNLLR